MPARRSLCRLVGVIAALIAWAQVGAQATVDPPALQGGVEQTVPAAPGPGRAPPAPPLRPGAPGMADPDVGRCHRLLANVIQAWQLTPGNLGQCRRLKVTSGGRAAGCWARADQAMSLLEQAYAQYREADRLRHLPASSALYRRAVALTEQAMPLVESLRDCRGTGGDQFHANPGGQAAPGGPSTGGPSTGGRFTGGAEPGPRGPGASRPAGPLTGGTSATDCPDRVVGWSARRRNEPAPVWPLDDCRWVAAGAYDELWCRFEWNPVAQQCARSAPSGPPLRARPLAPPAQPPPATPETGYWAGVRAGLVDCSHSVQTLIEAFQSMARGDFVSAARQLHLEGQHAALIALWKDISETPVLDANGQRLSDYEVGRRQAARLCLHVLLPQAQGCALRGTACALRTTAKACAPLIRRVSQLRDRIGAGLFNRPARPPLERGLLPQDHQFLSELAVTENLVIVLRDSNAAAARWIGKPGYAPKPQYLKAKTLKESDLQHLPPSRRAEYVGLVSAKDMSLGEIEHIRQAGFEIGSAAEQYVIRSGNGTRYFSDADLHGLYRLDGSSAWSNELASRINCGMKGRMVQHPPHDLWPERNRPEVAGVNAGPQVGDGRMLTALLPDGRALSIQSLAEMKSLYRAIGIDFNSLYPGY